MSKLKLEKVCKYYGNLKVIDEFDLEVDKNEFLVIVGPSGCGKSTLLRSIGGICEITSGKITLDDFLIDDKYTAMVFQDYGLFPSMNVIDNIIFGLKKKKANNDVYDIARMLKIDKLLNRYPAQLSGGEKQRVAIARAIARKPKIYLFDEPLSNVDANIKREFIEELWNIYINNNAMFIYVTHDQEEAFKLATKILILDRGKILQYGSRDEIIDKPNSLEVVKFLSIFDFNTLNGKIVFKDKKYFINYNNIMIKLDREYYDYSKLRNYKNRDVVFSFRSEQIVFRNNGLFKFKVKKIKDNLVAKKMYLDIFGQEILAYFQEGNFDTFDISGKILIFDNENGKNIFL